MCTKGLRRLIGMASKDCLEGGALQAGHEVKWKRKRTRDMSDSIVTIICVIALRCRFQVDICPWVVSFDEDTTDIRLLFEM